MHQEYYSKLGLPEGGSKEEVKKRYRQLVKSIHPDVNKSPDANKQFIEITEAYEVLIGERQSSYQELHDAFNSKPKTNREDRFRKAMEEASRRKFERQVLAKKAMEKAVLIYTYIVPVFFFFSLLSLVDIQLEERKVIDNINRIEVISKRFATQVLVLENHDNINLRNLFPNNLINNRIEINYTPILGHISGVGVIDNSGNYRFFTVQNNVIGVIRFLSFVSFILTCLFFYSRSIKAKFNIFIYIFFSELMLVVFMLFHGSE